jgi:PAS domain S-box-containing protein
MTGASRPLPPMSEAFERAPCGLLTTTAQGTIVRANSTFCRWTGYQREDLVEKRRLQDLLTIGGKVFHQTHWAPLLQMQRSVAEVKLDIVHRSGTIVPMLINAARQRYGDNEFDEFALLVVADRHKYERELLWARQQAEVALEAKLAAQKALELADRRKDEFLATLAHELRNPLAPIASVVELLRLKDLADPQLVWSRDVLERQLGHIAHLVDDLLDISRIAEGKIELRRESVDLTTAMRHAIEGSRSLIDGSSHTLSVEYPEPAIFVDADQTRLAQIIQNLLNNAAKYTPSGGKINLSTKRDGNDAVIRVRDTGIGIAAEHLSDIFDIFSQLPSGRERAQGGLGIGLSLVHGLTEMMGGSVSAKSDGVGKGSEFVVRLPAVDPEVHGVSREEPFYTAPASKMQRVVIIDDDDDAATGLAMVLEADGHTVRTAPGGKVGLQLVHDFDAQAVILDISLHDMSGYDVARSLKDAPNRSAAVVIALTGWGRAQDKEAAQSAGFDFHFTKPADIDGLLRVLQDWAINPRRQN